MPIIKMPLSAFLVAECCSEGLILTLRKSARRNPVPNVSTFNDFTDGVRALLDRTAAEKQYTDQGPDGPNELYEFVQHMVGGHGHALGEIVYKAKRFAARGNCEDLLKIAAWAFLIWRFARPNIPVADLPDYESHDDYFDYEY